MISDILRHTAARWQNKCVSTGSSMTYGEMYRRTQSGAAWIGRHPHHTDDGLQQHVVVICSNCPQVMEWHYSCAAAGAVVVNVNPHWTSKKVSEILRSLPSSSVVAVVYSDALGHLVPSGYETVCVDSGTRHEEIMGTTRTPATGVAVDPGTAFQLYFTSGTTGIPKSVYLSQNIVFQHAVGAADEMRFEESDRWLQSE